MYAPPQADQGRYQAKLLVNIVVAVFLIIGLFMVMQYFNFVYLRDVPVAGGWLMDMYQRVFGVPQVLILHGDDSNGDWVALRDMLSNKMVFYSEDLDVRKYSAGLLQKLKQYGLVIVEDAKTLGKDKLVNLEDYVKGGGNLIWVGDAGTKGIIEYQGNVLANQTGWFRDIACIDQNTMSSCSCKTVNATSACKFLPTSADGGTGQIQEDFTGVLGVGFVKNEVGINPRVEIVDTSHWSAIGIVRNFNLTTLNKVTSVSNTLDTALIANINMGNTTYPGVIVNDLPGTWGSIVYFSYPPEMSPELLLPIVERLRY